MKPTIECAKDGPYLVKGLGDLRNSKGERLATDTIVALCRCGGSANKPFCDGTHKRIGFSGDRLNDGSTNRRDSYAGTKVTIHDNRAICAHAGICTDRLAAVFRLGSEPWIDPDGAQVEKTIETVMQCPSGALSYSIDGTEYRDQERGPMVTVTKDGPYAVTGAVGLLDSNCADGASTEHYTLCRCGGSKNKPFCDGVHWNIKFSDKKN